jgi:hypothetical protein
MEQKDTLAANFAIAKAGRFSFAGFRAKALGGTSGNRCRPVIPAVECATISGTIE